MKLAIVGLQHAPTLILPTPNKSEAIRTWQNSDGSFTLPDAFGGSVVRQLTLEDDKVRAFLDMPDNVTGVWMVNAQNNDLAHSQAVPSGVKSVNSLYESIEYLQSLYI